MRGSSGWYCFAHRRIACDTSTLLVVLAANAAQNQYSAFCAAESTKFLAIWLREDRCPDAL